MGLRVGVLVGNLVGVADEVAVTCRVGVADGDGADVMVGVDVGVDVDGQDVFDSASPQPPF